jgi:hypothetical protein
VTVKRVGALAVAAVLVVGGFVLGRSTAADNHEAKPRVYEGWAAMPLSMSALACCGSSEGEAGGPSYLSAVAFWRDLRDNTDDSWHEGSERPPCYTDSGDPFRARIGVIDVKADKRPGTRMIAWLECL